MATKNELIEKYGLSGSGNETSRGSTGYTKNELAAKYGLSGGGNETSRGSTGYTKSELIKKYGIADIDYDPEGFINLYLQDYNNFYNKWGTAAKNAGWSEAMSGSDRMRQEYERLSQRQRRIQNYLDQNRDFIGQDYYDEVMANLDSVGSGYQELQDAYNSLAEYYGQWGSQAEYDSWTRDYEAQQEAQRQNEQYRQNQQRLQELLAERDRLQGLQNGKSSPYLDAYNARRNPSVSGVPGDPYAAAYQGRLEAAGLSQREDTDPNAQRLQAINDEIAQLQTAIGTYQSGVWGAEGHVADAQAGNREEVEGRIAETLAGSGTYQPGANPYTGGGPSANIGSAYGAANQNVTLTEAQQEASRLQDTLDWMDYVDKYVGQSYDDNFSGQYSANRTLGRLSQDSSLYWNAYLDDPTEENRRMAETADELIERFGIVNEQALEDDGEMPWITRDLAQYMPQFWDQLKYKAAGAAIGAATLSPLGIKAGYVAGSAMYGYQTMRGAAFRELIKAGMDEQTAMAAARDEAVISSLIEAGDSIIDLVTLGGGKVIDLISDGGLTALKKLAASASGKNVVTRLLTNLGKYVLNAGGEYLEESTQEAVSIANQDRDASGILDLAGRAISTYLLIAKADTEEEQAKQEQMREAGMGGLRLGLMLGGGEMVGNATIGRAVGNLRAEMAVGSLRPKLQELTAKTLELNPNDKNALRVQTKMEQGQDVSGMEIYKMLVANEDAAGKKDADIVREAAAARLTELGETGDIETIAGVIARQAAGEQMRRKDLAVIRDSKYGQRVVNELNPKNASSGEYSSGWTQRYNDLRQQNREYSRDLSGNIVSPDVQRIANRLIRDGADSQEAGETARKLAEAGKIYGKQADVFTNTYLKGQSVEQYRLAFANIYQAGKDGVSRELIKDYGAGLTDAQKEMAYLAGQKDGSGTNAAKVIPDADMLDVNAEGKTIRTDTNEDIEPDGFDTVGENGTLRTKGGQTVSIRNVAFASTDDAILYNTIAKVSSSAKIANTLLKQAMGQDGMSAIDFAAGLMEAYEAGQIGEKTVRELADAEFAGKLTTGQREAAYNRGKRMGYKDAYRRQQEAKKKSGGKKEGKLHFDRNGRKFDSMRESSLAVMDTLAKALGVDIYVFESYVNKNGKRVYLSDRGEKKAPNGFYDPTDGSIHIDLNAGQTGRGTMLFTVAHELTHFIKDWSNVKYRALADALVKQYQKQGVSVSELVDNQIAKANQNGREMSRPEAFDEVVADSMESMLSDENAAAFLERLAQRDKGLKEKIVSWLKELAGKLKNALTAYKDVKPDSPEGKMVAEMEDFRKEIMGIYTSALVDAGENFRENGGNKNTTREGGVKMQIREIGDSGRFYVQADRQVITGDDPVLWGKQIERYINEQIRKEQDIAFPTSDGHILLLTARSAYKLTDRHLSSIEKKVETLLPDDEYALKGRAAAHIDELIQVARFDGYAPDALGKHENDIGEDGFNYFLSYFRDADGKYYRVPFSAAINEQEETTYSIGTIRQRSFPAGRGSSSNKEALKGGRKASGNIIYSSEAKSQEVKTEIQLAYEKALGKKADRREILSDRVSDSYGSMTYADISAEQQRIFAEERELQEQKRKLSSSPELLDAMDSYMNLVDDLKQLIRKRRAGDATQEELNRIDEVKNLREDTLKHISDIQESTGLNDVSRRLDAIREEKEALRKAADAAWVREGAEKENKAIKKSGLTAEEYFRKKAIKEFHFTTNFNEAGYLLPDGKMLNFSGGERNHRYRDHREIGTIYESTQGAAALNRFMSDGNIRIMAESPGIDITSSVEPTAEQYDAIRKFVNSHGSREGKFFVDFSDKDGRPAGKYSYQGAIRADRVINDIKYFYENGTTREQSDLHLFLSDRDPTVEATRAALEKENGKLREDVSRLRDLLSLQGKVTGGTVPKQSSVEAAAKWLNKYAGAKADVKELSGMLTDFYKFLATDKDYSWEDVQQRAMVIARYLQDNVQIKPQISDYARDVIRAVRGIKVTLDESQRAEAERMYGSYEAFRKAAFGTVTFVKEGGIPLDIQWQEWSTMFPGTFDSEITAIDQPTALMDAIDALRNSDTTVMEYAYNRESIAQDLAVAVYDSFWRVDALKTVADRDQRKINDLTAKREELKGTISEKNKQINKLRAEHRAEMDSLRKKRNETVAALKQKRQDDMKKLRTDYKKKLEDTRTRYQESREKAVDSRNRAQMRKRIQKTVNELNHLLLDGDKKRHVPESMRKAVAEILSAVNMETSTEEQRSAAFERTVARYNQRIKLENDPAERARLEAARDAYIGKGDQFKAKIDALAKAYEDIKNSSDPALQDAYSDEVSQYLFTLEDNVGDTRLGDMTLDQLKTVQQVLNIVISTIRNANKSFLNERAGTIEQQASRSISEVASVWGKKKESESEVGGWLRGFHYRNLKPIYLMRAIGSQALTDAYNNVRRGEDTWYRDIEGGRGFYLENARKFGYGKWDFEKTTTFSDDSGGKVKLTLGQILSLYAYAKREAAAEHLRIGGVVIEGEAVRVNKLGMKVTYHLNDATSHQLGPETLGKIIGTLTKEQRAFVDAMQDYLSTVMADKGNEVSLAMYGIKLFREKNYFPIQSAKQFVDQKNEPVGEVKLKNSGFTNKTVPKANNPMVLRDFMDVWADHVNEMSTYHAFVLAIEDFNRILNFQTGRMEGTAPVSLKQTIQSYMGKEAVSAVRELIQSVNGGARVDPAATFVSKAINKFKKNAVFASMSVVIQQPSAIVRAAALIDPRHFTGRIIDREKVSDTWEIIKKYAPVAGIKDMGYFDTNMGKSTVDYIKGPEHDGIKDVLTGIVKREDGSFDELLSMAPGYADKVTWCAIWEAVKRETAGKYPKLATRSEEFLQKCGERFTEVITQTQVYDSVFARSGNMRSKDKLMGMVTSFMAEPTTSINMIYDAVLQGTRGNKAYMGRAIGAVFGAAVLNAVLKSIVYAARDDDEDESVGEKYVSALVSALQDDVLFLVPNSTPFVRDIMSLAQGYSVERTDMTLADDIISAIRRLNSDKVDTMDKILGIVGSVGNLVMPAKNMVRAGEALWNSTYGWWTSESSTAMGIRNAAREGWGGQTVSNARQLYEARMAGDSSHEARVTARYDNQNSADAAVVSEIRSAFMDGDLTDEEARKHLILYGNTDAGDAYWKVKEWIYAKDKGSSDGYGKYNDLYDAILSGGDIQEAVAEFTENGYDEEDVMSNVKKEVGRWFWDDESETRISAEQAAEILEKYFGMKQGEIQETILKWSMKKDTGISFEGLREAYFGQIVSESDVITYLRKYGGMTEYDAQERVADWKFEAEHGYAYDDIKSTYLDDEITRAEAIAVMTEIGGKSRDDAEQKVAYWDYEEKTGVDYENKSQQYKRGIITRQQLRQALIDLGEYSGADADIQIEVYDWEQSGLQGVSFSRVKNWHEYCEGVGVSKSMWLQIALFSANTENDVGSDGKTIRYSAMKKVMAEINKLPISKDQKTAIARAIGWSEKNIAKYKPW